MRAWVAEPRRSVPLLDGLPANTTAGGRKLPWDLELKQIPGQLCPCIGRSSGKLGEAASSRGSSGIWPELDRSDDHERDECSSASWNVVALDLALHYSSFSPYSWQHTPPFRIWSDSRGFWPGNLLFLEPVLLQPRQGSQTWVRCMRFTPALFVVEVGATGGAQASTIALADHFHRQ
jgi:hypothetical protein